MSVPSVSIRKSDGNTGVVRPSPDGILAILAPSQQGDINVPSAHTKPDGALDEFGHGRLVEAGVYDMAIARKPVLLTRGQASTAGAYGTVTKTAGGTSVVTAGSSEPLDDFDVLVTFLNDGTIGVTGIKYTASLDGGKTTSAARALGTASTLTVLDSQGEPTGVSFDFAAGTILEGETITCKTTGPRLTNADLPDALEALRVANSPWEILLIDGIEADDSTVSVSDLWLQSIEAMGKFRHIIVNARMRDTDTPETFAAYKLALQGVFASAASIRVTVCADGGDLSSLIRGIRQPRPASIGLAARAMSISISTDPAYKSDGPISGYRIQDDRGNPKYYDEALYPGLDDLKLTALRTFDGESGTFINNARILSPGGSDYVFLQHARVMNRACEVAFQILSSRLSAGVRKKRKAEPTGEVYILESEAQDIEGLVNAALARELKRHVSNLRFVLSRTDDVGSNEGAELTGEIQNQALAYVKKFTVNAKFVRAIG